MADSIERIAGEMDEAAVAYAGHHSSGTFRRLATRLRALSPAGGLERGCDWYEDEDTGSRIVDFDFVSDHSRQLSLILKANGEVAYAAYINGTRMNGADAMTPEFYSAIRMLAASTQQEPGAERRSTHHVHRGPESLPCYCDGEADHPIGQEATAPPPPSGQTLAGAGGDAMESWHSAMNDAGELFSNAPDDRFASRASRVLAWIKANRPATSAGTTGGGEDAAPVTTDELQALDRAASRCCRTTDVELLAALHEKLIDAARRAREVGK